MERKGWHDIVIIILTLTCALLTISIWDLQDRSKRLENTIILQANILKQHSALIRSLYVTEPINPNYKGQKGDISIW